MAKVCCAPNCKSKDEYGCRKESVSFHRFPANSELRELWTRAIRQYDSTAKEPGKHASMCSEHFLPEDFRSSRGYRLLQEGAVPSQFGVAKKKLEEALTSELKIRKRRKNGRRQILPPKAPINGIPTRAKDILASRFHSKWLLESLEALAKQNFVCDTMITAGKRKLQAHSSVLSAASPFFRAVLESYKKPGTRYLTLPGFEFDVVEAALRFIYTGKVECGRRFGELEKYNELLKSFEKLGLDLEHLNNNCEAQESNDSEVRTEVEAAESRGSQPSRRKNTKSVDREFNLETDDEINKLYSMEEDDKNSGGMFNVEAAEGDDFTDSISISSELRARLEAGEGERYPSKRATHKTLGVETNESHVSTRRSSRKLRVKFQRTKTGRRCDPKSQKAHPSENTTACRKPVQRTPVKILPKPSAVVSTPVLRLILPIEALFSNYTIGIEGRSVQPAESATSESRSTSSLGVGPALNTWTTCSILPNQPVDSSCEERSFQTPESASSDVGFSQYDTCSHHVQSCVDDEIDILKILPEIIASDHSDQSSDEHAAFNDDNDDGLGNTNTIDAGINEGDESNMLAVNKYCMTFSQKSPAVGEEIVPDRTCHDSTELTVDPFSDSLNVVRWPVIPRKTRCRPCTTCQHCGKRFSRTARLKVHLRSHASEKPFSCDICGRRFSNAPNFVQHRKSHTRERQYLCDFCGCRFIQKITHDKHVVYVHSKESKYICNLCGKRFKTGRCYRAHRSIHNAKSTRHRCDYRNGTGTKQRTEKFCVADDTSLQ